VLPNSVETFIFTFYALTVKSTGCHSKPEDYEIDKVVEVVESWKIRVEDRETGIPRYLVVAGKEHCNRLDEDDHKPWDCSRSYQPKSKCLIFFLDLVE
jgi:hypothetical protein